MQVNIYTYTGNHDERLWGALEDGEVIEQHQHPGAGELTEFVESLNDEIDFSNPQVLLRRFDGPGTIAKVVHPDTGEELTNPDHDLFG